VVKFPMLLLWIRFINAVIASESASESASASASSATVARHRFGYGLRRSREPDGLVAGIERAERWRIEGSASAGMGGQIPTLASSTNSRESVSNNRF
jgi:hypothetical protein